MTNPKLKNLVVRDALRDLMADMAENEKLPTERELSERFGFSRMTIRQGLDLLEQESLIYRRHGSGSFVSPLRLTKPMSLNSFSGEMQNNGRVLTSTLLKNELVPAGIYVHADVVLELKAPHNLVARLRSVDEQPISLEYAYLDAEFTPGIKDEQDPQSLYQLLSSRYQLQLTSAQETVSAYNLLAEEADLLGCQPGSAALVFKRAVYEQRGNLVEQSVSIRRGDSYQLKYSVEA